MNNITKIDCSFEDAFCVAPSEVKKILGKVYYDYEENRLKSKINPNKFHFEIMEEQIYTGIQNNSIKACEYLFNIKLIYSSLDKPIKEWSVIYPESISQFLHDYSEDVFNFAICGLVESDLANCKELIQND